MEYIHNKDNINHIFRAIDSLIVTLLVLRANITAIDKHEGIYTLILIQPILITTIVGVDWSKTLLLLQQCVGPILLQPSLSLDFVQWLLNHTRDSQITYIYIGQLVRLLIV